MPELPEVETIARGLAPVLIGRTFTGLTVLDPRVFPGELSSFERDILGREITGVCRRAKLLMVELADGSLVVFHLKMTGRVYVAEPAIEAHKHLRVLITLDNGLALHFQDMRRFGTCRGFAPGQIQNWEFFASLGPEPLGLSPQAFALALAGKSGHIKALLLNQKVMAGVGNIYADEALFAAGISPKAQAKAIKPEKLEALLEAIKDVLVRAIQAGGSTIRDYRTAEGVEGAFQWSFKVYGKSGQPCPRCGATLRAETVTGRTSTFCPRCQP